MKFLLSVDADALLIAESWCVACQVRKTSHAAMLLLLEHSLISKGKSLGQWLPVVEACDCCP